MEEERIKSALEIAMERISTLPRLTPGEIAEQKEKEYGPLGEALCRKYLDGIVTADKLPAELARYGTEQKPVVQRALIRALWQSIHFEDGPSARTALSGIALLNGGKAALLEEAGKSFQRIFDEFEREKQEKLHEFAALANEELKRIGVSGSAVRLNLKHNESWQQELSRIRQSYEPKLKDLKDRLLQECSRIED